MANTDYSQAACVGEDPELFFPVGSGPVAAAQEAEALAVCASCPIQAACLEDSLSLADVHGVRGGMTGEQRAAVVPRRRVAVLPVAAMMRSSKRAQTARELASIGVSTDDIARRIGVTQGTVKDYLRGRRERGAA